jgi:hypothetical protein
MPPETVTSTSPNPYRPPAASAPAADRPPASVERCGPHVLAWSMVLAAAYALVAGAARCAGFDFGLKRFGGLEYVPRVVSLMAIRALGPGVAAMASALTAVVVLDRAGRRGAVATAIGPRVPLFAGAATVLGYPVAVCAAGLGALLVWCIDSGDTARAFVATMIDAALWSDVAHGIGASVIGALAVSIGLRLVGARLLSRRWSLFPKLLVAWVALQVLGYGLGYLGRWLV